MMMRTSNDNVARGSGIRARQTKIPRLVRDYHTIPTPTVLSLCFNHCAFATIPIYIYMRESKTPITLNDRSPIQQIYSFTYTRQFLHLYIYSNSTKLYFEFYKIKVKIRNLKNRMSKLQIMYKLLNYVHIYTWMKQINTDHTTDTSTVCSVRCSVYMCSLFQMIRFYLALGTHHFCSNLLPFYLFFIRQRNVCSYIKIKKRKKLKKWLKKSTLSPSKKTKQKKQEVQTYTQKSRISEP